MEEKEKIITFNKKAKFEYEILYTLECGIVLTGTEVKSLREGKCSIVDGYVIEENGEIFLKNVHISEYKYGNITNHEPLRKRKLLLHKREILKLKRELNEKGKTVIPLKIYFKGSLVKVEIAVCRGKKLVDKRETIKARDIKRNIEKEIKGKF